MKKPCTHCGECCLAITCALGQAIFLVEAEAVCPAIEIGEDKLYYCGLINDTPYFVSDLVGTEQWKIDVLHSVFVKLVGVGIGCTNGEQTGEEHKVDKTFVELLQGTVKEV